MFDANMRYLPKGYKFFASLDNPYNFARAYDVTPVKFVECEMLDDCKDKPNVLFKFKEKEVIINARNRFEGKFLWAVYEGTVKGTDFINEEVRTERMKILEEKKHE